MEAETGKSITKYVDGNKYTVHIHKGIKDGEWETIPLTHRNGTLNVKVQVIPNEDKKSENVVPKHVKRTGYVVLSTPWEFESRTILEEKKINVIYDLVNYEITVNKGTKDGDVISVPLRGKR